jgi:hypothetical protein
MRFSTEWIRTQCPATGGIVGASLAHLKQLVLKHKVVLFNTYLRRSSSSFFMSCCSDLIAAH